MTATTSETGHAGREAAARLGPVGLWTIQFEFQPIERVRQALAELEELGHRSRRCSDGSR
jgi:hypothetical protein